MCRQTKGPHFCIGVEADRPSPPPPPPPPRAAVGRLGVRPDRSAWQAKLVEIIVYKCQSLILLLRCQSTKRVRRFQRFLYTFCSALKPVSNPDLWEYNPEELLRFTPLRRFSSTVAVQTHPLSGLISIKVHTSKE